MRDSRADLESTLRLKPSKARLSPDVMNDSRHVDERMRNKHLLFATEFWAGLLHSLIGTIANRYKPQ